MSSVSTFGAFSMAKLGIWASQKAMQVTGNNITNINTEGYTRQELKLDSLAVGGADRYASKWDAKVGSGVIVSGVRQIRSPYLDIRYRTQNSTTGKEEEMLNGLYGLDSVFDEVGKGEDDEGVMEAALQNMIEQLTHYNTSGAGEDTFDTVFRGSTEEVLNVFNTYARALEDLYNNTKDSLQEDVQTINTILQNIRHLNVQIRKADIHGGNALEMRDSRNLLIDELSRFIRIDVIYDEEDIGSGIMVEKLTIRLDSADEREGNHHGTLLVDGKYATQLKVPDVNVPEQKPEPEFTGLYDVTLDALRDERGRPKMLVEPEATVLASDPQEWVTTDAKGNITAYRPKAGGSVTIGGYTTTISAPDNKKTAEENVEAQLREFCGKYNSDPNNTTFRASVALEKNCVIFTAVDTTVTPAVPTAVDTATLSPLTANGNLTIGGYTVGIQVDPTAADPLADQLKQFIDAYNSDPKNAPNRAGIETDANGRKMLCFDEPPLDKSGELTINGYSVFIKGAEGMTRRQQLEAFRDVYNQDPDTDPDKAILSEDGSRLIFQHDSEKGALDQTAYDNLTDLHVVKRGVEGVPDPDNLEVKLTDNDLYGALQSTRELLTEEGEFSSRSDLVRDPKAAIKRGIPYYQKIWDAMARKFAETLNDANTLEDETTGDLKRGANGGYIVEPVNYYLTDKNGNYIDADGNIIQGDPDNPYSYKEYYTTTVNNTEVYADKDGNPLLSDPQNPTSYIPTGQPNDSYLEYTMKNGKYVDAQGNELTPTGKDAQGNDIYTVYLQDADGRYLNDKGQVVTPNPNGTYCEYLQNGSNQFVDAQGNVITPNADGSYWQYKTNPTNSNEYWDDNDQPIQPNTDKLAGGVDDYCTYKTETDAGTGTVYYLDKSGNRLDEVGKGTVPAGAVITGDRRVPATDPAKNNQQIDRRVETTVDRRVTTDPRVFTDKRVAAIKSDKRVVREQYRGGVLFSNSGDSNDTTGITAKNISISLDWSSDAIHVMQSRDNTELTQSTANSNILHMVDIATNNKFAYKLSDIDEAFAEGNEDGNKDTAYFTGSFADMLTKINATLAKDTKEGESNLLNANNSLTELATDRDSVSGVDLNDEAINMMQYNKSYSAACRFMTTLDEMIDKLINGTAI